MKKKNIILMNSLRLAPRFMSTNEFSLVWGPHPLVTLPLLATMVPKNWNIKLLDPIVYNVKLKDFGSLIQKADVVSITCTASSSALNTEMTIKLIRQLRPDIHIVLGGHHSSFYPKEWLEKGASIIVRGEGEYTLKEILESIEKNEGFDKIKGISFISGNKIIHNPDRELMPDLDALPFPRWDLMDFGRYNQFTRRKGLTVGIETTRGCTNKCSFCLVNKMWKGEQRYRSLNKSMEDIKRLYSMGARQLGFVGDGFGNPPDRHMELMKAIQKEKMDIDWMSFMRVDSILKEPRLAKEMAKAGCKAVFIGFESPFQNLLKIWQKGPDGLAKVSTYQKVYELLDKEGILVFGFLIVGHPQEPEGIVPKIFREYQKWCDIPLVNAIQPMKGTLDYEDYEKKDLLAKDMFYHDIRIPSLKGSNRNVHEGLSLFGKKIIFEFPFYMFSAKKTKRQFFRHMYLFLIKKLLETNLAELKDYWLLLNFNKMSPSDLQNAVINRNLNPKKISKLAEKCRKGFSVL